MTMDGVPGVRYWVFNYMPEWEAVSKEIASLLEGLGQIPTSLVALNTRGRRWQLAGRVRRIPLPAGLPLYPWMWRHAAGAGINHLFASAAERWLSPMLVRQGSILTLAKGSSGFEAIERNGHTLARFRAIVVQSEHDRDVMRQLGVPDTSLRLIRPGVPVATYREATGPFTVLFASSPTSAADFLTRGIYLMIRTAARLPDVRFLLVWRRRHLAKLRRLIAQAGVRNIDITDGVVADMGAVYDAAHAAILPALEHRSFVAAPRSGLESLAHGKPLLASPYVAIAHSAAEAGAAVLFEPTVSGLEAGIRRLRDQYAVLQANTQRYVRERYSPATHLELHLRLYRSLGV